MNKKFFISFALIALMAMGADLNSAMADDKADVKTPNEQNGIMQPRTHKYVGEVPPALKYMGPGPKVDKNHPMELNFPKYKHNMELKKAEFEKRLNLTEEQKKKIEENRQKDHEKVKPIFEELQAKKKELRDLRINNDLSQKEKDKKAAKLKKEIRKDKETLKKYHEENMKNFEAVLTKDQKAEFAKIKAEQKAKRDKFRAELKKKKGCCNGGCNCGKNPKGKKCGCALPPPKGKVLLPVEPKPVISVQEAGQNNKTNTADTVNPIKK